MDIDPQTTKENHHMRHRRRLFSLIAGVVLVGALPTIAAANTTEAVAETGGMTLTVPAMPGVPGITIGVTLDEFGNITKVSVDGSDIILNSSPVHKVTFELGTDGSTTVQVKAKGEKLSTKVKTSNLGSLVGDHTWEGDIFGTDFPATVNYSIAQVAGATPYLEITDVKVVSDVAKTINGPFTKMDGDDDDDHEQEYESKATVTFTQDGYTKTLKIEVETKYDDDDDDDHGYNGVYGKLKVELKGKDRQVLAGADVYGDKLWTGLLCDGTTATVNYTVAADGTMTVTTVDVADGASYSIDTEDDGFKVEFTDTEDNDGAKLKVELEDEHGTLELKVKSKTTTSCDDDDDEDHDKYKSGDDDDDDDHSNKSDDDDEDDDDKDKDHSNKSDDDDDEDDD